MIALPIPKTVVDFRVFRLYFWPAEDGASVSVVAVRVALVTAAGGKGN